MAPRRTRAAKNVAIEFPMLEALGLYASPTKSDGNCLFNALSDQLHGDESHHRAIRSCVVNYMRQNPTDFRGSITVKPESRRPKRRRGGVESSPSPAHTADEIEKAWVVYLNRMDKSGEWGGHLEILAFTHVFDIDVMVHTVDHKLRVGRGSSKTVHIAYNSFCEHYSSIRSRDGPSKGEGKPNITITILSTDEEKAKAAGLQSPPDSEVSSSNGEEEQEDAPNHKRRRAIPVVNPDIVPTLPTALQQYLEKLEKEELSWQMLPETHLACLPFNFLASPSVSGDSSGDERSVARAMSKRVQTRKAALDKQSNRKTPIA